MELAERMLSFQLSDISSRLFFEYDTGAAKITMMYDSGAELPVWCSEKDFLLEAYPESIQTNIKCSISGFGKHSNKAAIYKIPSFQLYQGGYGLKIRNLHIAVVSKPEIGCDFIISETMLMKTDTYILRNNNRKLIFDISFCRNELFCTPKVLNDTISGISIWSQ